MIIHQVHAENFGLDQSTDRRMLPSIELCSKTWQPVAFSFNNVRLRDTFPAKSEFERLDVQYCVEPAKILLAILYGNNIDVIVF